MTNPTIKVSEEALRLARKLKDQTVNCGDELSDAAIVSRELLRVAGESE